MKNDRHKYSKGKRGHKADRKRDRKAEKRSKLERDLLARRRRESSMRVVEIPVTGAGAGSPDRVLVQAPESARLPEHWISRGGGSQFRRSDGLTVDRISEGRWATRVRADDGRVLYQHDSFGSSKRARKHADISVPLGWRVEALPAGWTGISSSRNAHCLPHEWVRSDRARIRKEAPYWVTPGGQVFNTPAKAIECVNDEAPLVSNMGDWPDPPPAIPGPEIKTEFSQVRRPRTPLPGVPNGCMRCFVHGPGTCLSCQEAAKEVVVRPSRVPCAPAHRVPIHPAQIAALPGWDVVNSNLSLAQRKFVRADGAVVRYDTSRRVQTTGSGAGYDTKKETVYHRDVWVLDHPVLGELADYCSAGAPERLMKLADLKFPLGEDDQEATRRKRRRFALEALSRDRSAR